jgi:hypothetical protein
MEDIVASLRMETRRVAVRSTDWLDVACGIIWSVDTALVPQTWDISERIENVTTVIEGNMRDACLLTGESKLL